MKVNADRRPKVQPLRINKNTPTSSPAKMNSANNRPLSEISPMERRRNSPSYNQATKVRAPIPHSDAPPSLAMLTVACSK